jgi:hypothetical protein
MKKLVLISGLLLSGCSSIISGTSQTVSVNTSPSGANCKFIREGLVIGEINSTPGSVLVKKTKHNINIECTKNGYEKATYFNKSGVEGATFGNIVLGGGIGWAVDSASGADNKYTEVVNITLPKK